MHAQQLLEGGAVELAGRTPEGRHVEHRLTHSVVRHGKAEILRLGAQSGGQNQAVQRLLRHCTANLGGRFEAGAHRAQRLLEIALVEIAQHIRRDALGAHHRDGAVFGDVVDSASHAPKGEGGHQNGKEHLGDQGVGKTAKTGQHLSIPRCGGGTLPPAAPVCHQPGRSARAALK